MRQISCFVCQNEFTHWQHQAKFCSKECRHKDSYRKNRKKQLDKNYQLQKLYGITLQEYHAMKFAQNNSCKICNIETDQLDVDHCHTTGKVRALLCRRCNLLLGQAKDNVLLLQSAIQYLQLTSVAHIADLKSIGELK